MDQSLFAELKRRRVFRALVAWGIGSFAVLQIIEPIMHGLHWPDAVLSYVVVALALGFPAVVALAWVFDINQGRIERTPPSGARGRGLPLALLGIGLLAAAPGLAWYLLRNRAGPADSSADVRSIAVLPFASVSPGDENRYFADAMHIELLSQLARIGDLKVISRTSVLQYREGARNVREIGAALGVGSVLEGSVQRAGGRVRIQAQLIDAASDRQLWAEHYDRDTTDLFAIQTAVAEDIAKALHARLSPQERSEIARRPTTSPEAFALYLKATEYASRPEAFLDNNAVAEELCRKALELDPSFALAHARLSRVNSFLYWFNRDHTAARMARAREEAQRALALQPDLPEAHAAMGFVHYWGARDYPRALEEFEHARRRVPETIEYIGYVQRRQGRFEEALRSLIDAARLDPASTRILSEQVNTLVLMRRYPEAERVIERWATLAPDLPAPAIAKAYLPLVSRGDAAPGKALLRKLSADPASIWKTPLRNLLNVLAVNPEETLALLQSAPEMLGGEFPLPSRLLAGLAREALGDVERGRADFEAARAVLEAALEKDPADPIVRCGLGLAYAGLGRKQEALREARRASQMLPVSRDAVTGPDILEQLAAVEARVGEAEAALDHLEGLLHIPSNFSVSLLRLEPAWAPLRGHPRFQKLVAESRL